MTKLQPLKARILARMPPQPPVRHGGPEGVLLIVGGRVAITVSLRGKHGAGRFGGARLAEG